MDNDEAKQSILERFISDHPALYLTIESEKNRSSESYELHVTRSSVAITAPQPVGLYYGVQTLAQMIQVDAKGLYISAADIATEPSTPLRGVPLFPGRGSVPSLPTPRVRLRALTL